MTNFNSRIVCSGTVNTYREYQIDEFDEDDGWFKRTIPAGEYQFRVLDIRGWKPRQILIGDQWIDVADKIPELEHAVAEINSTKGS